MTDQPTDHELWAQSLTDEKVAEVVESLAVGRDGRRAALYVEAARRIRAKGPAATDSEDIDTTRLLYTVDEAAKWLKVSRSTLYREMDMEVLDYVKIGRARRIPRDALLAYLDQEDQP